MLKLFISKLTMPAQARSQPQFLGGQRHFFFGLKKDKEPVFEGAAAHVINLLCMTMPIVK